MAAARGDQGGDAGDGHERLLSARPLATGGVHPGLKLLHAHVAVAAGGNSGSDSNHVRDLRLA